MTKEFHRESYDLIMETCVKRTVDYLKGHVKIPKTRNGSDLKYFPSTDTDKDIDNFFSDYRTIFSYNYFDSNFISNAPLTFVKHMEIQSHSFEEIFSHKCTHFAIENDNDCCFALISLFKWIPCENLNYYLLKTINSDPAIKGYIGKGTSVKFIKFIIDQRSKDCSQNLIYLIKNHHFMTTEFNGDTYNLIVDKWGDMMAGLFPCSYRDYGARFYHY